jgi:hypothetical protein
MHPLYASLASGHGLSGMKADEIISGVCGTVLLVLTAWLVAEAFSLLALRRGTQPPA